MAYVYEEQKLRRLLVAWPPPLASTFALPSNPNMCGKADSVSPVDGFLPSATRSIPARQKPFLFRFCSLMIFFHLFCSARRARASCFNAR